MKVYSIVGKRVPPIDGRLKATGEAVFTVDMKLPGMLYGKILRSPFPHARILNINADRARSLPGVRAVITGADVPHKKFSLFTSLPQLHDQPALAIDKVSYIGDEVAAVAATDEWIAEEALELISVEYEEFPPLFDPQEAMAPGAPRIHEHVERNISRTARFHHGDVDQAFGEAYYIREDTFATQPTSHCAFEVHAAVAQWDPSGKLTLWSSTQSPFKTAETLAYYLDMPLNKIRVTKEFVGGGFGGKADGLFPIDAIAALLSRKTGRPVKIVNTREEEFCSTRRRHPYTITLKTGVKRDGTLLAVEAKAIADTGAYNSWGPAIIGRAGVQLIMGYRLPNVRYEGQNVYTNHTPSGAFRGWGNLQMRFAADSQMDMIAEALGVDPVEIRLKNAHHTGDVMPNKAWISSCAMPECIRRVSAREGWKERRGRMPRNRGLGAGIWAYVSSARQMAHDATAAVIKVFEDGTVTLFTGATDIGQGSNTTLAQIVAEVLGIEIEEISVVSGDTETTPFDFGTYSSRVTYISGNAVKAAAEDVTKQLFAYVAEDLEADVSDLVARGGRIYVKGSPSRGMSFRDGVRGCLYAKEFHILGKGLYTTPTVMVNQETYEGHSSPAYEFGADIAEVEVDRETGQVRILRIAGAHDCGQAINPMHAEGQLEGSAFQGLGQSLYEELILENGQVMNPSFLEYKVPTALDMPEIRTELVEEPDPGGPFGAKGMSEGSIIAVSPAIANAVYHAVGVRCKELPITPEKVLQALKEKDKGGATK
ncbi:MAG: xanthine dehydrogenase family protein molybdopterin-binding subunit [Desulfobacterales bacterium]|nr:xanthine dehydrogenase family protein molybdopterin-binding subunit [Desulfobacterales bacterium]